MRTDQHYKIAWCMSCGEPCHKPIKFLPEPGACGRAAVGSSNNTFGIKGVEDYCFFFKSITNASELRRRMSECFERAALPHTSPKVHRPVGLGFKVVACGALWCM